MAFPIAAVVAGASALGSSLIGASSNKKINQQNLQYNKEMYQRQYDDNLKLWNMSNNYNAPQEQMKRLQEAGLNPNLIYGSGGQTGGTASPASAPSAGNMDFKPTAIDLPRAAGTAFDKYFDYQVKNAQLDNLKAQNDVILEEANLKRAQTGAVNVQTGLNTEALPHDLDYRIQRAANAGNKAVISANEAEIVLATKPATIQQAAEKLIQMRTGNKMTDEQIQKIRNDQEIQRMNIDLQKNGIRPTDPIYYRFLGTILSKFGYTIK